MLKQLILHITRIRVRNSQIQDAIKQEQVIVYLKGAVINIKLQLITLFTFLHFNTPRYPSDKKTEVNFFNYSVDLGIVEVTPTLIKIFNEIYDSFEIKKIDD